MWVGLPGRRLTATDLAPGTLFTGQGPTAAAAAAAQTKNQRRGKQNQRNVTKQAVALANRVQRLVVSPVNLKEQL